jgi:hypothetical protein
MILNVDTVVKLSPHSSAEVKVRVELYLYSPFVVYERVKPTYIQFIPQPTLRLCIDALKSAVAIYQVAQRSGVGFSSRRCTARSLTVSLHFMRCDILLFACYCVSLLFLCVIVYHFCFYVLLCITYVFMCYCVSLLFYV